MPAELDDPRSFKRALRQATQDLSRETWYFVVPFVIMAALGSVGATLL